MFEGKCYIMYNWRRLLLIFSWALLIDHGVLYRGIYAIDDVFTNTNNIIANRQSSSTSTSSLRGVTQSNDNEGSEMKHTLSRDINTVITHNNNHSNSSVIPDSYLRIVGGVSSTVNEFSFYGRSVGRSLCGATLIHSDIMLTAAHCAGSFTGVYLGGNRIDGTSSQYVTISAEYPHPSFVLATFRNDIMLLKLSKPITNIPIQTLNYDINIPSTNQIVTTIGYGRTSSTGPLAETLQKVNVRVIDNRTCSTYWRDLGLTVDSNRYICAGELNGGKDSCQGDSGGPLLYKKSRKSTRVQVGIVSFGIGCATPNSPPVYTRISGFKSFIQDGICRYSSKPPSSCKAKCSCPNGDVICWLSKCSN